MSKGRIWPDRVIVPSLTRSTEARQNGSSFESDLIEELPVLYRVASRLTGNRTIAEDLVGQTVLIALGKRHQFDGLYFRSWLIQILHRLFLREGSRATNRQTLQLTELNETGSDNWAEVDGLMVNDQILSALDQLPTDQRMAIVLCDIEDMNYDEAARVLEVPIGTIRSRLFRGRRALRERSAHLLDVNQS